MFKNAFANLQKVGKSLMLPVSVLPIAGILLGVGSANFQLAASRGLPRYGRSRRFSFRQHAADLRYRCGPRLHQ